MELFSPLRHPYILTTALDLEYFATLVPQPNEMRSFLYK